MMTLAATPCQENTTLLGSTGQLCATFFHANSWEADVKLCLHWPADASGEGLMASDDL